MVTLDWHDASRWNGGRHEPCRLCGFGAFTIDAAGRPVHKVCLERLIDERRRARELNAS